MRLRSGASTSNQDTDPDRTDTESSSSSDSESSSSSSSSSTSSSSSSSSSSSESSSDSEDKQFAGMTTFEANPYCTDINPATTNGLKLYQAATEERDESELLSLKIASASQFIDAMKSDATRFGWGKLISKVSVELDGTMYEKNILQDFKSLSIEKVRIHMNSVFKAKAGSGVVPTGDLKMFDIDPAADANDKKIFFLRVRSHMIGLRILGSLDKASLKSLKMKEKMYLWENSDGERFYDGPTMLQICIEKVSPSTRVGVSQLKETLRNIKASSFGHNVRDLTDKMDVTYREILQ